jgi:ribose 5-phosphate isomerase B
MIVAIGANDRGCVVRDQVIALVRQLGHRADILETLEGQAAEYPEIAAYVARRVHEGSAERGILIGRTGMGMCIVANKFPDVRAAVCHDDVTAETTRRYLDVNVLCLSAELVGQRLVHRLVETWLVTPFDGGRHARRIDRISVIEQGNAYSVPRDIALLVP